MKVIKEYKTHHYVEEYNKTDWYCPNCGKQELWECTQGDYYNSPNSYCTSCGFKSQLLNGPTRVTDDDLSIIDQLTTGVTLTPTTKPGR